MIETQLKQQRDATQETIDNADLKVILIGDAAVGKSKMIERFLENDYNKFRLSTHALTLYRKDVKLGGGENVKIDLWDTGGQEKFNSLHASYYFQANAAIMVFDVTRKMTYVNLKKWYEELRLHCEGIPVILAANKIDIDHLVTRKNYKFAEKHNLPLFFVSSADGTNVVKVFEEAIYAAVAHKKFGGRTFVDEALELFQEDFLNDEDSIN